MKKKKKSSLGHNVISIIFIAILVSILGFYFKTDGLGVLSLVKPDIISLGQELAPRATVTSYSEVSKDSTKFTLRVESHPHKMELVPEKIFIVKSNGQSLREFNLNLADKGFACSHPENEHENLPGYVTSSFTLDKWVPETTLVRVVFKDRENKLYSYDYKISHTCSQLNDDAQLTNSPDNSDDELPEE